MGKIFWHSHLNSNCQVVLLDSLKVQRLVDLHISVCPTILLSLLQIERVVFVGLVRRATNELIEYGWVVLNARAKKEVGQNLKCTLQKVTTHGLVCFWPEHCTDWFCENFKQRFKRKYKIQQKQTNKLHTKLWLHRHKLLLIEGGKRIYKRIFWK